MCPGHLTDLNIFHRHSKWIHFNHLCCFWLLCLHNLCRGCNSHWHIHRRPSAVVFWVGSIVSVSNGHRQNQSVTTSVNLPRTYHLTYDHTCILVAGLLNSLLKNIWCKFNSCDFPKKQNSYIEALFEYLWVFAHELSSCGIWISGLCSQPDGSLLLWPTLDKSGMQWRSDSIREVLYNTGVGRRAAQWRAFTRSPSWLQKQHKFLKGIYL